MVRHLVCLLYVSQSLLTTYLLYHLRCVHRMKTKVFYWFKVTYVILSFVITISHLNFEWKDIQNIFIDFITLGLQISNMAFDSKNSNNPFFWRSFCFVSNRKCLLFTLLNIVLPQWKCPPHTGTEWSHVPLSIQSSSLLESKKLKREKKTINSRIVVRKALIFTNHISSSIVFH